MLWDWRSTWLTYREPGNPDSGGRIELGVAWYDQTFFDERCGAGMEAMHRRIYQVIGIPLEKITIRHFLAAERATWTPAPVDERQLVTA